MEMNHDQVSIKQATITVILHIIIDTTIYFIKRPTRQCSRCGLGPKPLYSAIRQDYEQAL